MKLRDIIIFAVGGFLVFLLMRQFGCGHKDTPAEPIVTTDTSYVYDTVTHVIHVPKPYPVEVIYHDTVWGDTSEILHDYFAEAIYERYFNDGDLSAQIIDTISQNRISGSSDFAYEWLKPQEVITNTNTVIAPNKTKVFVGLDLGSNILSGDSVNKFSVTPKIFLLTKKDKYFSIGYDLNNQIAEVGIGIKIKLKK